MLKLYLISVVIWMIIIGCITSLFKEGIKKTIAWFFENEEWMKNVTSGDYQKYYADMYEK